MSSTSDVALLQQQIAELETSLQHAQTQVQLLRAVMDSLPNSIYLMDTERVIQVANRTFCYFIERSPEDTVGRHIGEIFSEGDLKTWDKLLNKVEETGESAHMETSAELLDSTYTFTSGCFPIFDENGKFAGISGMTSNITEQRQAEQDYKISQSILQAIIDTAPSIIFVKSPEGRLITVNKLYSVLAERETHELVGLNERDLISDHILSTWHEHEREMLKTAEAYQYYNSITIDGEEREFFNTTFPLYDDKQKIFAICLIGNDITDLRRAEREHHTLQTQIIEAQRATLRELSTPLIPLDDETLVMPLIGSMDTARAQQVMETLLDGVAQQGASSVIIDVTGLTVIDTSVANALVQITKATHLLGAEVILTGIGAEVAQTLVHIGADLQNLKIAATLQSSIAQVLGNRIQASKNSYF
jgi:rsbT co-antagonist protein RsbR